MDSNQPAGLLALGVGVGVGLGVMLTAAQSQTRLLIPSGYSRSGSGSATDSDRQLLEAELSLSVQDGREITCTFDNFPYYLNEQTKVLLTNAAFVHLKQLQYSKFTRHLSPASRSVLLSGPIGMETYHQMLAKALAHFFQAKLLILDITSLALKIQKKRGLCHQVDEPLNSASGIFQRFLGSELLSSFVSGTRQADNTKAKKILEKKWKLPFCDKTLLLALQNVLQTLSEANPTILFLRDVEKIVFRDPTTSSLFQKMFNKLSGPIFIIGSRVQIEASSTEQASSNVDEKVTNLFPYKIDIKPPEDEEKLNSWKSQLEEDMKAIRSQDNKNHISEILAANDIECEDFDSLSFTDTLISENIMEEIVVSAISYHLMNTEEPQYNGGRLVLSPKSLAHGLSLFQAGQIITKDGKLQLGSNDSKDSSESSSKGEGTSSESAKNGDTDPSKKTIDIEIKTSSPAKEFVPDNEFEKRIRPEIIPAGSVGVSFQDIGALEDVKEILHEAVMLPLQRPDLFSGGGLIKPCKGILLFGPPGTGKTMLAKAVATEAGASFINVSMSTITSKWFGEDEKNVRALFTLAAKVAPTIIFIDEVDSMLGQRSRNGEHEAMRKIKNEFMAHWDGLLSKPGERVLVLAATNRPFDLDDAIIRRFERRIIVGLPNKENREKILRRILEKESVADDIDYAELAAMTEGYTGSDLKNLCTVAAYRPLRELMKKEQQQKNEKKEEQPDVKTDENKQPETTKTDTEGKTNPASGSDAAEAESSKNPEAEKPATETECSNTITKEETSKAAPQLRPLNMEDLKQAKRQVSSSFASEGAGMGELKEWNELFGEGGSRKKEQLSYFL